MQIHHDSARVRAAAVPGARVRVVSERAAALLQVQDHVQDGVQDPEPGEAEAGRGLLSGLHEEQLGGPLHPRVLDGLPARHVHSTRQVPVRDRLRRTFL